MSFTSQDDNTDKYRLPTDVKPIHYDLTIRSDLEELTFQGLATITLEVVKETSDIVFNAHESLKLHKVTLHSAGLDADSQGQDAQSLTLDAKKQRVTASFASTLQAGSKAKLSVSFEAKLAEDMKGYYRSSTQYEGKKRYYALTQFEPTAARRAFPCWDEPLLKATYTISLISRDDTVNLSNMPAESEQPYNASKTDGDVEALGRLFATLGISGASNGTGWKITKFQTTPKMSSYLVGFANGPFSHVESSYTSPLSGRVCPLRIYATPDIIDQTKFALEVKSKVMPLYEKAFDVEYPLPKLDTLVAHDFDFGAMENWGLITGRTSAFLLDPNKAGIAAKKRVAGLQAHECAHMWFGDIVTMAWWDNLYLKEGFATLMGENMILDKVFPEWSLDSEFITKHLEPALKLDSKRASHPIEVECPDADQINQIFDDLSYSKGASVLRMLASFVGEKHFLEGCSIYLKKRLYGNSVTNDLWNGITKAVPPNGPDVATVMKNWVSKIGFPVLKVTETESGIHIRQDRFLETGDTTEEENQTVWHIPLRVLTTDSSGKTNIDQDALLDTREIDLQLDTSKPFKLNAGTTGVYRVLYSPERLKLLALEAARKNSSFSLKDRMGLVSDAMVLAKSGYAKTSSGLDLIHNLRGEDEYVVWSSISDQLDTLSSVWWEQPESVQQDLRAFFRSLFSPLVKKLGFDYHPDDSAALRQLRTLAITEAASAGDKGVVAELQSRFKRFQETGDDSNIPVDLQRIIFCTAVKYGSRAEYETLKDTYEQTSNPMTKIASIGGMSTTSDPNLAKEILQWALSEGVRTQDTSYFWRAMSSNHSARRILAEFTKENFDKVLARHGASLALGDFIQEGFSGLSTERDLEDLKAFFKGKDVSKFNLALAQSIDSIRGNATWLQRSTQDVADWLAKWRSEGGLI